MNEAVVTARGHATRGKR